VNREGAEVTSAGRALQTRASATEKARRPTVSSLTACRNTQIVRSGRPKVFVESDVGDFVDLGLCVLLLELHGSVKFGEMIGYI